MGTKAEIKSRLQQMDGYAFEKFVADLWTEQGWKTNVRQASQDQGIDIVARRTDPIKQKHLIQAKRYSAGNKVSSEQAQQYSSLQLQEDNVDAVIIVTTSSFTDQAKDLAPELNLKLINGDDLVGSIHDQVATDLLNDYTNAVTAETDTEQVMEPTAPRQDAQRINPNQVPRMHISKLLENAMGSLVTKSRLLKMTSGITHPQTLTSQPLLGYLYQNEQPHFTLRCAKVTVPQEGEYNPVNNGYLVATSHRVFLILGFENQDWEYNIPYRDIRDVWADTSFKRRVGVETDAGEYSVRIALMHHNESQASDSDDIDSEVQQCVRYIRDTVYSMR